jgi:hypothetical protein
MHRFSSLTLRVNSAYVSIVIPCALLEHVELRKNVNIILYYLQEAAATSIASTWP